MINKIVTWGCLHPKRIFLLDGIGALLSAFMLGIVLVNMEEVFGIPVNMLYLLAALPVLFAIFDFLTFYKSPKDITKYLKAIAIANFAYCVTSLVLAITHRAELKTLGWIYLAVEMLIVLILAYFENYVVDKIKTNKTSLDSTRIFTE